MSMHLKSCPECQQLTAADNDACPYCGYQFTKAGGDGQAGSRSSGSRAQTKEIRNPLIAALCAFLFMGWGQWYNGRTAEGIYVIAANAGILIVGIMLMYVVRGSSMITTAIAAVTGLVVLGIWVYSIATAYNTARGINRGGTVFTGKSLLFWMPATLWFLLVGVIAITIASPIIPGLPGAGTVPSLTRAAGLIPLQVIGL
jgi:hypothetical protein